MFSGVQISIEHLSKKIGTIIILVRKSLFTDILQIRQLNSKKSYIQ